MELKKNNLISLLAGFIFLCLSLTIESSEFNYNFYWTYIPVAKLSIYTKKSSLIKVENGYSDLDFAISTEGPLKIYRNYTSQGYIKKNGNIGWDYRLSGVDRGQPEEKFITFFHDKAPEIKKFIDDSGVLPITIDKSLDRFAIDPYTLLTRVANQLISKKTCQNTYRIMDGKRRYTVNVSLIEKENSISALHNSNEDIIYKCEFTLIELEEEKKKWPFNRRNRSMVIWFSTELNYLPIRFKFQTPIGSVVGNYNFE